ncbi:thymidine kinase [Pelagicoccus sp. SDUM812005]|uniref:thymidine kinase n=1 Tax=Pelagicoccus sp. SDUM812005 TaxID=3041257 RepID=UPI00280FF0CF|nr:thymidine kinase [Pelagicoccus sp. SDUM812005]MDQ8180654.1 thymidine kinase [Pelagicoccus sp. SDUM812005]
MAKLHFIYGTVGSGKSLQLLSTLHNYKQKGLQPLVAKPAIDCRFGENMVASRSGLKYEANLQLQPEQDTIPVEYLEDKCAVLIDECQFVTPALVDHLRHLSLNRDVPVLCYGLKTDFQTKLFPASQRLIEVADTIQEIKNLCRHCERKATMNIRIANGTPCLDGPIVQIGADELYQGVCFEHYHAMTAPLKDRNR